MQWFYRKNKAWDQACCYCQGNSVLNILVDVSVSYWRALSLKTPPPKCQDCRQYLDDSDLKFFQGDPDNAVSVFTF